MPFVAENEVSLQVDMFLGMSADVALNNTEEESGITRGPASAQSPAKASMDMSHRSPCNNRDKQAGSMPGSH